MKAAQFLRPGDIPLYGSKGWAAVAIKIRTNDDTSHAEVYLGNGQSAGSRGPSHDGPGGVKTYPLRLSDMNYILRPIIPVDLGKLRAFHESCIGQKYALLDLLKVHLFRKDGDDTKAVCSEHVARCFAKAGACLFERSYDCDYVTPAMLKSSANVRLYRVDQTGEVCDVDVAEIAAVA
jgi:hypothetical protein